MKKFKEYLKEQLINEAPAGPPGGLSSPAGLPPGGPPAGMGGPPPMGGGAPPPMGMGGPPPMGGGAPSPMGGPPPGGQGPAMKLKAPDVWNTLEKILGIDS